VGLCIPKIPAERKAHLSLAFSGALRET
jgi:hypothetical protein